MSNFKFQIYIKNRSMNSLDAKLNEKKINWRDGQQDATDLSMNEAEERLFFF